MDRTQQSSSLSTADARISYGYFPTAAGDMMAARSPDGICYIGFCPGGDRAFPLQKMKTHFPRAAFSESADGTAEDILDAWRGQGPMPPLDLHGSAFQRGVWQALLEIPFGRTVTYGDIAEKIGRPKAARAVGSAVAANPVSLLVPCHRVLPVSGKPGNYAWGAGVKKILLEIEAQSV